VKDPVEFLDLDDVYHLVIDVAAANASVDDIAQRLRGLID
jgi:hypothetical protein